MNKKEWWYGYIHINGTKHVKRFVTEQETRVVLNGADVDIGFTKFLAKGRDFAIREMNDMILEMETE